MSNAKKFVQFLAISVLIALFNVGGYAQKGKVKIVVLNFDDTDISKAYAPVGKRVANYTIDKLVKSEVYVVVERDVIDKIIKEQNFGASGRVDKATAAEIGKIAGADLIIYGSVSKYKYEDKWNINIFKRKGKGVVELTARIADSKTAVIVDTIQVKGEVDKEKVDMSNTTPGQAGGEEFKATIMNDATYDAANKLAAALEKRAGGDPSAMMTPATEGNKTEKPGEVKPSALASRSTAEEAKPASAQQKEPQPQTSPVNQPNPSNSSASPKQETQVKQDKLGLVSNVTGNTLLIVVEQQGQVKVGDRLLIKRITGQIPDPYNPGRNLGYNFDNIGFVTISEIVSDRVVKGTFAAGGRRAARPVLPKFQDWVVKAP